MKIVFPLLVLGLLFAGCSFSGWGEGLYRGAAKSQEMKHDPEADRNQKMHQQAVGE